MGEVYHARDTRLNCEVAINKVLGSRIRSDSDSCREMLLKEARAISALNHPNITALYDVCCENDLSPDGNQVVLAWNGERRNKFQIYAKLVGSSNHLALTKGDANEVLPRWSPDGQWIAFERFDTSGGTSS